MESKQILVNESISEENDFVHLKIERCEQGSNLRGETPLDFESNALTTRPSQHIKLYNIMLNIYPYVSTKIQTSKHKNIYT